MPLYEYKCEKCGKSFELLQRNNEKVACPMCGGSKLEKLFSVFASNATSESSSMANMPSPGHGSCNTGCCGM